MKLDERKARILSAIVELFAATGEPVGSKALADVFDNAFSSATIRNEMAALSEQGLIAQPHTSSGRVPTARGYRLYVDQLMPKRPLDENERRRIDNAVSRIEGTDPEQVLSAAGNALAELTHCAAVSTTPDMAESIVRQVEVIPVTTRSIVLVLVLSASTARSRLIHIDEPLTLDVLERFSRFSEEAFVNRTVDEITQPFLQAATARFGDLRALPLFTGLHDLCGELMESRVLVEGQQHLLRSESPAEGLRSLFGLLAHRQELAGILQSQKEPLRVVIGPETQRDELRDNAMIVARYHAGSLSGSLGLIGPTRMHYPEAIATLTYFTKQVGGLIEKHL